MPDHQWLYQRSTLLGTTETVGPLAEEELIRLAKCGKLARETLLASPTRTNGQWLALTSIPGLLQTLERGEQDREADKERQRVERESQRQLSIATQQIQIQQIQEQRRIAMREWAQFTDCQNSDLAEVIWDRLKGILTSNEEIQFVAVQKRMIVNFVPDAIVATNRRLIFYRPKILGRFEFQDFLWLDLHDAHIQQNFLGATFFARHTNGQILAMNYLTQEGSQAIYRLAQEREEWARVARHRIHVDTIRAGASNINVTANAAQPNPGTDGDLIGRLQTLKSMADSGLITPEEYSERKQQLLSQL
jgi:hypothetical protein